ncbi:MAG: cyclic nucleotide-binding domain-containing protein [Thermoleophilia bacterium]|nr:cyclic nucleotide-binding domain-containing protein [Thermoleophilia bacterium]
MRIESSVTSVTWIPSEAIEGMPKVPFELGIAHYDEPPPDVLDDLDALHARDAFREANELKAFIEVRNGRIVDYGYRGRALVAKTRVRVGPKEMRFAAVKYPLLQDEPEVGPDWVRFVQTAGGHMGLPAPRRVRGRPFFRVASASAWTTLQLVMYADGTSRGSLIGASPFPRHWVYDKDGRLIEKSAAIDFETWWREAHGEGTPWGGEDSPTLVTAVESELERELSWQLLRGEHELPRRELEPGDVLVEQGSVGRDLYLLLDGALDVEVDGATVAQLGPGAIVGERALLEGGARTSTLRAATRCRLAVVAFDDIDERALRELAAAHRRERRETA